MEKYDFEDQKGKVVRTLEQTGKTNRQVDIKIRAKKPGKRISASGLVYWETRRNRSDVHPTKKI